LVNAFTLHLVWVEAIPVGSQHVSLFRSRLFEVLDSSPS
jgi:hypothetical protein